MMYELYLNRQWQPCPDRTTASKAVRDYITEHDLGATDWYRRREGMLRITAGKMVATVHYNGKLEYV